MQDGLGLFHRGDLEQAALSWREAARLYEAEQKLSEQSSALVHLAQHDRGRHAADERVAAHGRLAPRGALRDLDEPAIPGASALTYRRAPSRALVVR